MVWVLHQTLKTVTPATVPDTPTGLNAETQSGSEIKLTWTVPANTGGSQITGYQIERQTGTGSFEIIVPDNSANPPVLASTAIEFTDTGLTRNTSYTYKVSAINVPGTGSASDTANAITFDAPGAPTLDEANRGNGQVELKWTVPANTGGTPLTNYIVQFRLTGSNSWDTFSSTVSTSIPLEIIVTGLTNGNTYEFQIITQNLVDQSAPSNVLNAKPATLSNAPENLSFVTRGDQFVTIGWDEQLTTGGEPILSYLVEYTNDANGDFGTTNSVSVFPPITADTPSIQTIVSGLTNGVEYTFRVSAVNTVGTSDPSNEATGTPATTPNIPTDLNVVATSDTTIDLTWTAPGDIGGFAITGYQIERQTASTGDYVIIVPNLSATPPILLSSIPEFTDTGLVQGTLYTYKVSALTAIGTSPTSGTSSATTFDVPDAPSITGTQISDSTIALTWSEPANNGAAIISYLVQYSTDGTFDNTTPSSTVSSTSETISDLINGQVYTLQVSATNSIGTGLPSSTVTATPATVPGIPNITGTLPGDESVTITWTAPSR